MVSYYAVMQGGYEMEVLRVFDEMPSRDEVQRLADEHDCTVRVLRTVTVMKVSSGSIQEAEAAWYQRKLEE